MSKKLIAGLGTVAALGIAALPVAGVFADNPAYDTTTLRVNVPESVECTSTSTDTDFVWFGNVVPGTTSDIKTITVTGETNAAAGFTIAGVAGNLVHGTMQNDSEPSVKANVFTADNADTIDYGTTADVEGTWWLTEEDANASISGANITLDGANQASRTFTLSAAVLPSLSNVPGVYQGTITWTCSVAQP